MRLSLLLLPGCTLSVDMKTPFLYTFYVLYRWNYSRTSTNGHLSATVKIFRLDRAPIIIHFTLTTSLQRPVKSSTRVAVVERFNVNCTNSCFSPKTIIKGATVFTRISAAALIKFFAPQMRRLFEGGAYLRAAFI